MSATSHDAFPDRSGKLLKIGASALDGPDPTEDIADEITSELAGAASNGNASSARAEQATAGGADEPSAVPAAGSVLRDRYVLEMQLGSGGNAVVFRAVDLRRDANTTGGRHVAVKLLRPERRGEPRGIARLQREFRQTLSVAHPNVVRFFDLDCDRGSWFIVMELLTGETLAARLRRIAPAGLPAEKALAIAAGVADALAHAHRLGVSHGDIKPANIFLTDAGEVRLLDFGVTPDLGDAAEPVAGTRAYASPEVQGGQPGMAADDVYSLACLACEMLTGSRPRGGPVPERPPGVHDSAWQCILRGIAPQRSARPGMDELAQALHGEQPAGKALPAPAPVEPAAMLPASAAPGAPPARRSRLVAVGAIVAGLMLLLGILIGRLDQAAQPSPAPIVPIESAEASAVMALAPMPEAVPEIPAARLQAAPEPEPVADAVQDEPVAATGLVTFEQPSMIVSNRALVAAIPLRHLSTAARDVDVNWRIIEGSARPGRDYGGPESGVESFVAGNSFRILYVPIVANPASTRDRTFVVELTGATQGVEIGGAPRVAVTILGDR